MVSIGVISRPLPRASRRSTKKVRESVGALLDLIRGGGSSQEEHEVGLECPAGPDLLAADDVAVAVANSPGGQLSGVGAGIRLSDGEGLQAQLAAGDLWQVALVSGPSCRGEALYPWCTSGRDRLRRCSRIRGWSRAPPRPLAGAAPEPPYSSGMSTARYSCSVSASTKAWGYSCFASSSRQYSPGELLADSAYRVA